jgi:hypothetical protein
VIEPRQDRERLGSDTLYIIFVGRDLYEGGANFVQLGRVAAAKAGKRGAAGLERTILIAPDLEESRGRVNLVTEECCEDRIPPHSSVGVRGDAEEIVSRVSRSHSTEICNSRVRRGRWYTDVIPERDYVPVCKIDDDSNRTGLARVRGVC